MSQHLPSSKNQEFSLILFLCHPHPLSHQTWLILLLQPHSSSLPMALDSFDNLNTGKPDFCLSFFQSYKLGSNNFFLIFIFLLFLRSQAQSSHSLPWHERSFTISPLDPIQLNYYTSYLLALCLFSCISILEDSFSSSSHIVLLLFF